MWYLIAKLNKIEYRIYDSTDGSILKVSKNKIIDLVQKGDKFQNVKMLGDSLSINKQIDSRLCDDTKQSFTILSFDGVLYRVVSNKGILHDVKENELFGLCRKYVVTNVKIDVKNVGKPTEKVVILAIGEPVPSREKVANLEYDIADFECWRKNYAKIDYGVNGSSAYDGGVLTGPFGAEIKQKNSPIFEFIRSYKLIRHKLCKDKKYKIGVIFDSYYIEKGSLQPRGKVLGYHILWEDNMETFLLAKDKKLCNCLIKSNIRKSTLSNLTNLLVYNRQEPDVNDSITTSIQISDNYNQDILNILLSFIKEKQTKNLYFDENYRLHLDDLIIRMKYKSKINSRDTKTII